jgi:hypothetical protein
MDEPSLEEYLKKKSLKQAENHGGLDEQMQLIGNFFFFFFF